MVGKKSGEKCSCIWSVTASKSKKGVVYWVNFSIIYSNVVGIVMREYTSIAVNDNMHFVLCCCCYKGRFSVNIHLKCQEKVGNLIMTGEWPS